MTLLCFHSDTPLSKYLASFAKHYLSITVNDHQPLRVETVSIPKEMERAQHLVADLSSAVIPVVFILDGSWKSSALADLAAKVGGLHWYVEYFVKPRDALDSSRNSFSQEVLASGFAFFSSMRAAQSAAMETGLDTSRIAYLPFPVTCASSPVTQRDMSVALVAPPAVEYRLLPLFRLLMARYTSCQIHWLLETEEHQQAQLLLQDFPQLRVTWHFGRSPEVWNKILLQSQVAYHCSESPYDTDWQYTSFSFASGVFVVCSDYAEGEYISREVAMKVRPGLDEYGDLSSILEAVSTKVNEVGRCRDRAIEVFKVEHCPVRVFERCREVLASTCSEVSIQGLRRAMAAEL